MMKIARKPVKLYGTMIALLSSFFVGAGIAVLAGQAGAQSPIPAPGQRLITLHDSGVEKGILTDAPTLRQAFKEANVPIDPNDTVEPSLDEQLIAKSYDVNI